MYGVNNAFLIEELSMGIKYADFNNLEKYISLTNFSL